MSFSRVREFVCLTAVVLFLSAVPLAAAQILVLDGAGGRSANAEVWVNCSKRGVTDLYGRIDLSVATGDHIIVRKLIREVASAKGAHDGGWAYHIWHTNVVQNDDGTMSDEYVGDPTAPHIIVIRRDNAMIGFNFVVSTEFNATSGELKMIRDNLVASSQYLYDVSDGQMFIENAAIYDDAKYYTNADVRVLTESGGRAHVTDVGGKSELTSPGHHIYLYSPGVVASLFGASGKTLIHELGHYAMHAADEYYYGVDDGAPEHKAMCTADRRTSLPVESRASIMDKEDFTSEFCYQLNHNKRTHQEEINHASVWETVVRYWDDDDLDLKTPYTRGNKIDPGPFKLPCPFNTAVRVEESTAPSCSGSYVTVLQAGRPVAGVRVVLTHGSKDVELGTTNTEGVVVLHGAAVGDVVSVPGELVSNSVGYSITLGHATVAMCGNLNVPLFTISWPIYYWFPKFHIPDKVVELEVPVLGDPVPAVDVLVTQAGLQPRRVSLQLDQQTRSYRGALSYDARYGPSLKVAMRATDAQGNRLTTVNQIEAKMFLSSGPGAGLDGSIPTNQQAAGSWSLLSPDASVELFVDSQSMPSGTSVSSGTIEAPSPLPPGFRYISRPIVLNGDQPLSHATLTMHYDLSTVCKPQQQCAVNPQSFYFLKFNWPFWEAAPIRVDTENQTASTDLNSWGIYALIAPSGQQ